MAERTVTCWSCGATLTAVPHPIGRREQCPHCTASLHACRQCAHYDPVANKACREPVADEVVDKEGGNFCDYFQPHFAPGRALDPDAERARAKLSQAFGGAAGAPDGAQGIRGSTSSAEEAKRKLEAMFGKKK